MNFAEQYKTALQETISKIDTVKVEQAIEWFDEARAQRSRLLGERTPHGYWTGQLSTSALSTATAVSALALVRSHSPMKVSLRPPP